MAPYPPIQLKEEYVVLQYVFFSKNPYISGPVLFKPVLFKDQLYITPLCGYTVFYLASSTDDHLDYF